MGPGEGAIIWLDFENAPHAWVLAPIARRLERHGFRFLMTARDFSSTVALCRYLGLAPEVLGPSGSGRSQRAKLAQTLTRAARLRARVHRESKIVLAISHGSRSQMLASFLSRVPAVTLDDYEYSFQGFNRFARHLLVPEVIPRAAWGRDGSRVVHYPGLKEELYLTGWLANRQEPDQVPLPADAVRVLLRPGSESAHYQSERTERLQAAVLDRLAGCAKLGLCLIPRDRAQGERLTSDARKRGLHVWIPPTVLDGPALIAQMDVVLGGGGTMTREAAVLGVPAYSFFGGQWGAVDCHLERQGRLHRITTPGDVEQIQVHKRTSPLTEVPGRVLDSVGNWLAEYAERVRPATHGRAR